MSGLLRPSMGEVNKLLREAGLPAAAPDTATVVCCAALCTKRAPRHVRVTDSLAHPTHAGWREVEVIVPIVGTDQARRIVAFACSLRCEAEVRAGHTKQRGNPQHQP